MDAIIEAHELTKTYAQGDAAMRALDDVSLDLRGGELTLLVGPSGSGKTTLLSILGCILRPTSGTLRIMGQEVTRLKERDLPAIRRMVEGAGFHGHQEVEIFSAEDWWKRPGDEVLKTCVERYNTVC